MLCSSRILVMHLKYVYEEITLSCDIFIYENN